MCSIKRIYFSILKSPFTHAGFVSNALRINTCEYKHLEEDTHVHAYISLAHKIHILAHIPHAIGDRYACTHAYSMRLHTNIYVYTYHIAFTKFPISANHSLLGFLPFSRCTRYMIVIAFLIMSYILSLPHILFYILVCMYVLLVYTYSYLLLLAYEQPTRASAILSCAIPQILSTSVHPNTHSP